ncbi:MAG: type IV pilus secretin PilQ, partial [Nitrospirae bacterium]|nr:type IV pilus secretin PilQ [Nitrospirota bacterium]
GTSNKLDLDFQNASILSVLKILAQESNCNIVPDPTVQGQITMQVKDTQWNQVVELILKTYGLDCDVSGNIIRIAPIDKLRKEKKDDLDKAETELKTRDTKDMIEPLVTRIFRVNYATVDDIKNLITTTASSAPIGPPGPGGPAAAAAAPSKTGLLSSRGSLTTDKRTSSIIVVDIPRVMGEIEKMIKRLDKPTPQVLIEARIVEVTKGVDDSLGINWGILSYNKAYTQSGGAHGLGIGASGGPMTGNSYLDTLPAVISGLKGGVALGFINAAQTMALDMKLTALESNKEGKILTNPRLLTMDNQKASISQGQSIPYPKMNAQGEISADFKDVTIKIDVTPQITPDNSIIMQLMINKEDFITSVKIGGSDAPQTSKMSEETKVLVKDGETLVLGGVFRWKESTSDEGIPLLKDIPILGWLFKTETLSTQATEYLIFITPRIVNREIEEPPSQ